jgi:glutaredoxin
MVAKATLYREQTPEHTCPFGLKAKRLLEDNDFEIDEHILSSREEVEAYKAKEGVATTPQIFIDGKRVGGSDDLEQWLAHARAS